MYSFIFYLFFIFVLSPTSHSLSPRLRSKGTPNLTSGDFLLALHPRSHGEGTLKSGIFFFFFFFFFLNLLFIYFVLSQPKITQQGHPQIRGFFFSLSPGSQQGLPLISNQGMFHYLSLRSHNFSLSPRSQQGLRKNCPPISNQGIFFSQPKITQQGLCMDCPRSLIRGFFLSAQDPTLRTAHGLPLISNQGTFSLSPRPHSKNCAWTAPDL